MLNGVYCYVLFTQYLWPLELNLKFQRLWSAAKFVFKSLNYKLRNQKLTWKPVEDEKENNQ